MRTKKMYTNKSMRTGVILAAIAIITLIALIMTFAKYASQGTGEDSARVAKWGLNVDENLDLKLFSSSYKGTDGSITVDASDDASVVAPGTSQEAKVKLATYSGQAPEVMYHFEPSLTITNLGSGQDLITKLNQNNGFKWTLKVNDGTTATYDTTDEICTAVADLGQKDIAPNTYPTNFGTTTTPTLTIGWNWDFNNGGDQSDTELGNLIANNNLTSMKVELGIKAYQCQGCTTPTEKVTLKGTVSSYEGKTPVQGASVAYTTTTSNGTTTDTTDENGEYKMQVPKNSTGIIEFTKDGYESQKQEIGPLTSDTEVTIKNFEPKETTYTVTCAANPSGAGTVVDSGSNPVTEVSDLAKLSKIYVDAESKELVIVDPETGNPTRYHTKNAEGYTFKEWQGIPDSGTITDNITVTAVFEQQAEKIDVTFTSSPSEGGYVVDEGKNPVSFKTCSKGSYIYKDSGSNQLTIYDIEEEKGYNFYPANNDNYIFSSWQIIDGKEISEEKIELTSDTSVAAIFKKAINKPTINSPLIYNGSLQQGVTYDDTVKTHCTIEGTTEATDANDEYSATFKIDDSVNFMWSDGDKSSTFTADWIIEKATNDWKTKPQPISEYSSVVSSSSVQSAMFDETTGNYKGTGMFGGDASYTVVSESYEGENALEQGINNLMNTGDSYNGNFSISEDGNNLVCAANTPVNKYTVKLKAEIPGTNNYYDLSVDDLYVTWTVNIEPEYKAIVKTITTDKTSTSDKVFLPAYEGDVCPYDFYVKEGDSYNKIDNITNMASLAEAIKNIDTSKEAVENAKNVYTTAENATFFGSAACAVVCEDFFTGYDDKHLVTGINDDFYKEIKESDKDLDTIYGTYDDQSKWTVNDDEILNWDKNDESRAPRLASDFNTREKTSVSYVDYVTAYSTNFKTSVNTEPWSAYYTSFYYVGSNPYWSNKYESSRSGVILTLNF